MWQDEEGLQKMLYFANVYGAITVTDRGKIPTLPTKDVAIQFNAKYQHLK